MSSITSTNSTTHDPVPNESDNDLRQWTTLAGLFLIVVGATCLVMPFLTSVAVEIVIASALFVAGIATIISAFFATRWSGFFMHMPIGIVNLGLGGLMLQNPFAGLVSLTVIVAIVFLMEGILRILFAVQIRQESHRWKWILASGIVAAIFAVLILSKLPEATGVLIGILVGLNILAGGVVLVLFGAESRTRGDGSDSWRGFVNQPPSVRQ